MMEITASALDGQRFLHGLRADQLDTLAATASEVMFPAGHRIFAEGGHVGSFYQWAFGAVCVTEVKAIEFRAAAVRDRCAADPDLGHELTQRMFQVLAGRLQDTRARLIAKSLP
jgi:CRP/FNR family transcriptional regulator, cyclic AMP receptor protein